MLIESPEGRVGQRQIELASTPDVLSGVRVAALDNGKPGAALVLRRAGERLAERTGAIFVGVEQKKTAVPAKPLAGPPMIEKKVPCAQSSKSSGSSDEMKIKKSKVAEDLIEDCKDEESNTGLMSFFGSRAM